MVAVTHQNGFTSSILARPANLDSRFLLQYLSIQANQNNHK
jgi:hypothetical protein